MVAEVELALLPVVRVAGVPTAETGGDRATSARTSCVGHVRDDNDTRERIPAGILVPRALGASHRP